MKKFVLIPAVITIFVATNILILLSNITIVRAQEYTNWNTTVVENKFLKLYVNEDTTEIAVRNKEKELTWYSNPPQRDKKENIAQGQAVDRLNSQIGIIYYTPPPSVSSKSRLSSLHSVDLNQYEIERIDKGIRINYTIGKEWNDNDFLPKIIEKSSFEELLDEIPEADEEMFIDAYMPFQIKETEDDDERVEVSAVDVEKVFRDYTLRPLTEDYLDLIEEKRKIQEDIDSLQDESEIEEKENDLERLDGEIKEEKREYFMQFLRFIRDNIGKVERLSDITFADNIEPLVNKEFYLFTDTLPFIVDDMIEVNKNIGYTPVQVRELHLNLGIDPPFPAIDVFTIPLDYKLEKDELVVSVPLDEVRYPLNVLNSEGETVTYPLHSIDFLPFFGAADNSSEGYMIVPDGSGGLINLNNKKLNANPYVNQVYGRDNAFRQEETKSYKREQIYLPVFGLKKEDRGFLAIIEDGESMARIRADIAGRTNSYNNIFAQFTTLPYNQVGLGKLAGAGLSGRASRVPVYPSKMYSEKLQIRYSFFENDRANYVEMANYYQDYLRDKYEINSVSKNKDLPFILELTGAINKIKPIMGVASETIEPLTTFEQAEAMINKLLNENVNNLHIRYRGWLRGGVKHNYPNAVKIEDSLGGKSGFNDLIEEFREKSVSFYPDVGFLNIYKKKLFDSFKPRRDSSFRLDQTTAQIYDYNIMSNKIEYKNTRFILSPARLNSLVEKFLQDYIEIPVSGISLNHIGEQVNSDFRKGEKLIPRQRSVEILEENLNRFDQEEVTVMSGGNAYVLPYSKLVVDIPDRSTEQDLIDKSIPFYQIALRSLVNYGGRPINLSENPEKKMLKTVEFASGISFDWFFAEGDSVINTNFNYLYNNHFQNWFDEAVSFYDKANDVYKKVSDQKIIDHTELKSGVFQTKFANEYKIIVNYNEKSVIINGEKIPGQDFRLVHGGVEE